MERSWGACYAHASVADDKEYRPSKLRSGFMGVLWRKRKEKAYFHLTNCCKSISERLE